jgi:hypothetical protein
MSEATIEHCGSNLCDRSRGKNTTGACACACLGCDALSVASGIRPPSPWDPKKGEPTMAAKKSAKKTAKKSTAAKVPSTSKQTNDERVERRRYTEPLPVAATRAEVEATNEEWARVYQQQEELLEERRDVMAELRERSIGIREAMGELATRVTTKTKLVAVPVVEYLVVATGAIDVVRVDTGEIVSTRAADADDRQETLFEQPAAETRKGVRPTKRAKAEPLDLGDIDDPAAVLKDDAGVDAPPAKRTRGGKELPRTEEDRLIAKIDKKHAKDDGIVNADYAGDPGEA